MALVFIYENWFYTSQQGYAQLVSFILSLLQSKCQPVHLTNKLVLSYYQDRIGTLAAPANQALYSMTTNV